VSNATIRDYLYHNALTQNVCLHAWRKSQISRELLCLSVLNHKSLAITSGLVSHNAGLKTLIAASHHVSIFSRTSQGRQSQIFNEFI